MCGRDGGTWRRRPYYGGRVRRSTGDILKYRTKVLLLWVMWRMVVGTILIWIVATAVLAMVGSDVLLLMRDALTKHWQWVVPLAALCVGMSAYRHGQHLSVQAAKRRLLWWIVFYGVIIGVTMCLLLGLYEI